MGRESLRTSLGDVESQIHGRPGYITRYEKAILEQLADVAARDYQRLPSKVADRVPLQKFVANEVKKMLGTLSHNVTPQGQQNLINEEAQKRFSEIDERFRPYIEGLKGQTQKVRELLSKDRNIQSIREGIAADEQNINLLRKAAQQFHSTSQYIAGTPVSPQLTANAKEIEERLNYLTDSLEKKRQHLQDYENASSAFSQEIPKIYDFPKVYADVDERFRPYIEGLKGQTQKVRELLSKDRNIQSIREGIAADEQELNYLNDLNSRVNSLDFQAAPTTTLLPQFKFVKDLIKELPGKQQALKESLEKKRQYLQDYENASSAFSQEIPEIIDFPSESLRQVNPYVEQLAAQKEAEKLIPPVPPLESFTNLDSRGETFDPMVRQALKDNFSLGQEEIKAGFDQGTKHTRDMILGKALRVGESPLEEAREISDYLSDRNRYKGQAIYEEMSENYLSNILPKANLGFMQGAWNSPLRRSHNDRVLSNLHKDIVRTRMGMEAKTAEKGLEEAGQQQARQLYSAKGAADMLNQQQREASIAAETLGGLEKTKVGADLAKIEAARLIGGEEQALEGSRLQEIQNEALRQQEYDKDMLEKQMAISRGIPASSFATQQQVMQQPNYAAIGAGAIGNIASSMMFGQQPLQNRKGGGLINKYAPGGIVLPSVENDPQAQLIEQEAQSLLNQQYDPQQALFHSIAKAGDKIQERYTGMPGIAGDMADTHLAHKEAQEVKRARGLNLMQQIHASRIKQQEFLAEMDYKNRTLGEMSRHHRTLEGIKERKLKDGQEDKPKFEHQEQAKQHYKQEQILKNKFLEHQEDNQRARDMIDSMESSYKKGIGPTGPIMGHTPDMFIGDEKLANRQNVMGEAAEELFKILGKQKGVQSDKDMAEMRKTLPNEYSPDERWKEWFAKGRKMVERGDRYSEFINQASAKGLSQYEAQKMWNSKLKEESEQAAEMVKMQAPNGEIREVPANEVEINQKRGAKIV